MAEVASATVALLPTFKGGAAAIRKEMGAPIQEAGKDGGEKYGSSVLATFGKFAAPIAAVFAGAGVIRFFNDSVAAASDLNEAGTATQQVFGDAYSKIEAFASTASTTLGQSHLEALTAATTFGVFGKAAGLAGDDLSGFSTQLVTLAGDLASFYNTSPEQAIQAISAGLRGESEPLRQYGVLMDDAALKAKALELGIYDGVGALNQQQRVLAAQAVILAQTNIAQGDFARTSDGLANKQRILAAQTEDFKSKFGQALLPLFSSVVGALNEDLFPALEGFLPIITEIASEGVPQFIALGESLEPIIQSGFELAKDVLPITGAAFTAVLGAAEPVLDFLTDLDPVVIGAGAAFLVFAKTRAPVVGAIDAIGSGLSNLNTPFDGLNSRLGAIPGALGKVTGFLGGPWGLAIGAGVTALGALAIDLLPKAAANVDDLTASFEENTGAITDNTRASVFKALQEAGAVDAAKKVGLSLDVLTDAALGNKDAIALADAAMAAYNASQKSYTTGTTGGSSNMTAESQTLTNAIGSQNEAVQLAVQGFRDQQEAAGASAEAQSQFGDAVIAATESIAANGATLDTSTAQGLANQDALQGIADKATSLIDTQIGLGASTLTVQSNMQTARDAFIDTAVKMGLPIDQAQALADKLLAIPAQKTTDVVVNTYDALEKIDILKTRIDSIVGRTVEVNGTSNAFGLAGGGTVRGPGTSKSDSIPAWLSNGEEVIQEPYASRNRALLKAINSGMRMNGVRGFAGGGTVGSAISGATTLHVVNKAGDALGDLVELYIERNGSKQRLALEAGRRRI